ncbi:DUF1987 domain-containing protein [Ammoniphilus sp. CFH 90114]|uniref:DUF1987 domain-containing protein n=1 Tax=Ammoniphilus sp. CFH 90114 TaxID=2493665 RepID=UPI00100FAA95|nr:DUF1987 domain-containing protein [Ammoniphilus sp. CFH 90114]RXT06457.1 DUF1987 domain-containing protein [Ammoniphilus sp. CFH 90114]
MQNLIIEGTKSTPTVHFDQLNNILTLKGQSYPENSFEFYEPIFQWVEEYFAQLEGETTVSVDFILPYINTSSSKCIMMLLETFDKAYLDGKKVNLNWYYNIESPSELECAEEFCEDLNLPFNLIARETE